MQQPIDKPADGPLHTRWGPYIRNAQPIGDGIFLVESQRGTKGSGKVWNQTLLRRNPEYNPGSNKWHERDPWQEIGTTKAGTGSRGRGMFKVIMWIYPAYDPTSSTNVRRFIEAYFETELLAVQFMVRTAPEFVK